MDGCPGKWHTSGASMLIVLPVLNYPSSGSLYTKKGKLYSNSLISKLLEGGRAQLRLSCHHLLKKRAPCRLPFTSAETCCGKPGFASGNFQRRCSSDRLPIALVLLSVWEAVQERSRQPPRPAVFSRRELGMGQLCWKKETRNTRRQEIEAWLLCMLAAWR